MDVKNEKRLTKRFVRHAAVEIRWHRRSDLCAEGVLVDCSEGGVGFFSPEAMKRGDVILLRVSAASSPERSCWSSEAGQFNMVTAKVRWCLESPSHDEYDGFRVGSQRILPFY
jgi:hypothetical protein